MSAHLPPPASPTPPCEPEDELSYQADSNYNGEVGNSDGDVGNEDEEQESTTYPPDSGPAASNAPLPRATIPHLLLTQQVIDTIKNGNIHDDIQNPDVLKYLNNPPKSSQPMDASTTLSIRIFEELVLGSQKMYDGIRDALYHHTPRVEIHSYHVTRQKIETRTGISEVHMDMCPKGCVAYTGPYAQLGDCPDCGIS
jgi:hypothetical protein